LARNKMFPLDFQHWFNFFPPSLAAGSVISCPPCSTAMTTFIFTPSLLAPDHLILRKYPTDPRGETIEQSPLFPSFFPFSIGGGYAGETGLFQPGTLFSPPSSFVNFTGGLGLRWGAGRGGPLFSLSGFCFPSGCFLLTWRRCLLLPRWLFLAALLLLAGRCFLSLFLLRTFFFWLRDYFSHNLFWSRLLLHKIAFTSSRADTCIHRFTRHVGLPTFPINKTDLWIFANKHLMCPAQNRPLLSPLTFFSPFSNRHV